MTPSWALTVFNGRAGDHNERAMLGRTKIIGVEIAEFEDVWSDGDEPVLPTALLDALTPLWS